MNLFVTHHDSVRLDQKYCWTNRVINNFVKCNARFKCFKFIPLSRKHLLKKAYMVATWEKVQRFVFSEFRQVNKKNLHWKVLHLFSRVAQTRCVKWELPGCDFSRKHPLAIVCLVNFCRPQRPDFHTWEIKGYQGASEKGGLNVRGDKPVHKILISFAC